MLMSWVDWTMVVVLLVLLTAFSLWTARFMRGVADFLSANRSGGRYMLANASGMAGICAVSVVALFEMYYKAGFTAVWWSFMSIPVSVIIVLTGWVYYRFRETRCLTLAQFFEERYSRSFRVYAGIITWLSGIVNFGIFPAVSGRFFVYYCGLPPDFHFLGVTVPTFIPVMVVTLGIALAYTCIGGQVTVMVTDCIQGIFCLFAFIILCIFLIEKFAWADLVAGLALAPAEASKLHPYHTSALGDFDVWFFMIGIFGAFYGYMSWQGSQAYQSSGISPHEQKMSAVLNMWRMVPQTAMVVLMPVCAMAFLSLAKYADGAAAVQQVLSTIDTETIRTQMTVPVSLAYILPIGIRGLFCSVMIFFLITTQDTYLHSWGSIFIQDVILPFRKKAFSPETHVRLLRWSIAFVAVFSFVFSIVFRQTEYIVMFFAITGAIVSGAGAVIVGGLYWKRGTTAAAWTAMTVGWVMATGRIILQQVGVLFQGVQDRGVFLRGMDAVNAVNSQWIWLWTALACIAVYVLVSILTYRKPFNLEKMLHRDRYAVAGDRVGTECASVPFWWKLTGITAEFSHSDRWVAAATVAWNAAWFCLFILGTLYNLAYDVPAETWARFWRLWLCLQIGIGIPVTVWLTVGSLRDMKELFARLGREQRDIADDGRVAHLSVTPVPGAVAEHEKST